jgi:predicted metal-binding protein
MRSTDGPPEVNPRIPEPIMSHRRQPMDTVLASLTETARRLGASDSKAIDASRISAENELAALCREPPCENLGRSMSCPPHVSGPNDFRRALEHYRHAVVFKIDVPTEMLLSAERRGIFEILHGIASEIERQAVALGCPKAKAFAGGSCKQIFCHDHDTCRVLSGDGSCRHADRARPSMSGFGINVSALMEAAGWTLERIVRNTDPGTVPTGTVTGLVLVD